jgi:trimethylamine monooxygenase
MSRVAIIGAGPSGLAALRAFESARKKGAEIPELVCYERQSDWGGIWNYTWRTGTDGHGEPVHGSMYRYLWSNGPKECLEFTDYSFEEHFGRAIPSYPPRAVLHDYIVGRVERDGLRDYIKFSTAVRWVSFDEATQKFTVRVEDLEGTTFSESDFDYVINASGHFSTPNVPSFRGFDKFPGRVLHSHDFRDAVEMAGKDVLVVGSSYSAEDIGIQCHKYGAKSVTFSYRTSPMGFHWPETVDERPLLTEIVGRTVHFSDGSTKDFDAIVLCTGYLHHYPYLPDDLRLKSPNNLYPVGLYKGVVWQPNTRLLYVGAQDQFYTFNMFDAQAWWARDVILGRIELPDPATRESDIAAWHGKFETCQNAFDLIDFQSEYIRNLNAVTDYPFLDTEKVADLFKQWEHHKEENILTYRDRSYASVITGTVSPKHHTPWMQALDDSMEAFLANG